MPQISVILPAHNAERWLAPAIDSVLAQTHRDFELIAIDDGSRDGTRAIIEAAAVRDARVRPLVFDENRGIIAALNAGLDIAAGAFIARMDADDICLPERFATQRAYLEETGLDLCGSWFVEFGQGFPRTVRWPASEPALRAAMLFQNTLCHPTVFARRAVFDRFRYREAFRMVEDYDLFGRACGEFRLANLPAALLKYRRHPQQATQAKRDAMEAVNQRIRANVLEAQGFTPSAEELRLHNLVRAPQSIRDIADLEGIERWLRKLHDAHADAEARRAIASQWTRACIRAAPLGRAMHAAWRSSRLRTAAGSGALASMDLVILSALRLDYRSGVFDQLRRLGLSA